MRRCLLATTLLLLCAAGGWAAQGQSEHDAIIAMLRNNPFVSTEEWQPQVVSEKGWESESQGVAQGWEPQDTALDSDSPLGDESEHLRQVSRHNSGCSTDGDRVPPEPGSWGKGLQRRRQSRRRGRSQSRRRSRSQSRRGRSSLQ